MRRRRMTGWGNLIARAAAPVCLCACALFLPVPSFAGGLLPEGFFERMPEPGQGQVAVEANYLSQNADGVAIASGQVVISYAGYVGTADRLIYDSRNKDVTLIGNVIMRDPAGAEYASDRVEITGNMKKAVLNSLVMITEDGALVTASYVERHRDESVLLENGSYSPCGTCIDANGRRIGWRVRAERIIQNEADEIVDLESAHLEILGFPVAWVPWIRLPDPTKPRKNGFRLPNFGYSTETGLKVTIPYFFAAGDDVDLIFEPSLMSRQVGLMSVTLNHRIGSSAEYSVTASGTYVADRSAFLGTPGDRAWRGGLQASARFTPSSEWKFGASYSLLSDRAYLRDYLLPVHQSKVNQAYGTHLTPKSYADLRVQEFVVLGNATQANQNTQGMNLPRIEADHVEKLDNGLGQAEASVVLQNVSRAADSAATANGVSYVTGFAGNKIHGTAEFGWRNQWVMSQGIVFTPYVGVRGDFANYNGASALMPIASQLFAATPIAALDVRYPFVGITEGSTHIFEPIAQVQIRGSSTTSVGITNDNAQSFVFDDTNLFSLNRFSGTDRQETGARATWGYHYLAEFDDGSYIDLVHGQSYHFAGLNAFSVLDPAQTGTAAGVAGGFSDQVVGLTAGFNRHFKVGGKARFNFNTGLHRAAVAAAFENARWRVGGDLSYRRASPALGALTDQLDAGAYVQIPLDEYWRLNAAAGYDITSATLLDRSVGVTYDDGYFETSLAYEANGADPFNPTSQAVKWSFRLKTPDGSSYGF